MVTKMPTPITHTILKLQGCLDVLKRLDYSNGVATNYDNINWQNQDENYLRVIINSFSLRVHVHSKQVLDTCIPVCQRFKATHTASLIIYELLPWFISHQAIWCADFPKGVEQVAIYTTPPANFDQIKNGVSTHYFVAMNTAAMFYKPSTAQFVDQWGRSGQKFRAFLTPSPEILTKSEREEIDKVVQRR
jgi:hypothetical protein